MSDIKRYYDSKNQLMAVVIPAEYDADGINFITSNEEYQQIAVMSHPENHVIVPHYHNLVTREIDYTTETLVIRSGVLTANLYEDQKLIYTFKLKSGDIITLLRGGHGFVADEKVSMVEIKQGPFVGDKDKTRF